MRVAVAQEEAEVKYQKELEVNLLHCNVLQCRCLSSLKLDGGGRTTTRRKRNCRPRHGR